MSDLPRHGPAETTSRRWSSSGGAKTTFPQQVKKLGCDRPRRAVVPRSFSSDPYRYRRRYR